MASVITVAHTQLGTRDPSAYWATIWPDHPADAVNWCAIFVSYCFAQAGTPLPKMDETAVTSGFAYCPDAETWAKANGLWTTTPLPGDVVLFCWDGSGVAEHTGIVVDVNADGSIDTIEGNVGWPVGVCQQMRSGPDILGYISPTRKDAMAGIIVDLSDNNPHPIDYAAAKAAGVIAAIVKATEGTTYVNPYYATDVAGFVAVGVPVVAYHFASFTDPAAEAAHFVSVAGTRARVLDLETSSNVTWVNAFLAALNLNAADEMVYGSASTLPRTGIRAMLWPASYGMNYGFGDCWQFTDSETVAGITAPVDASEWIGTQADFDALFSLSAPTPTPTPTQEATNMAGYDPISGGSWGVKPDGAVFANDGAPYLGGLNNHPEWNTSAIGPAAGIVFWKGNGTDAGGNGYAIYVASSSGFDLYRFPRSGIYAGTA